MHLGNLINYKILSNLTSWIFPTKEDRRIYRSLCNKIEEDKKIPVVHNRYKNLLKKIKNKKNKIRVIFLISENSKWKAQSLYDLMSKSTVFEPIIALTLMTGVHKGDDITRNNLEEDYNFFTSKGMNVVYAYSDNRYVDLNNFSPDIVFYQQPWDLSFIQSPEFVSKFALTYYIPYYVNNYELQPIEYEQKLHKFVYKYFVLNKWWEEEYKKISKLTNVVGVGNPILDNFMSDEELENNKNYVIYAPHYSFYHELNQNPVNYGTFLENGELILGFAQEHKEYNWVFKPHPQLKFALYKVWGKDKTDKYYMDWENIGLACYNSSYIELFKKSKLLITDCDSFLLEYFCTSNPIIHIVSEHCRAKVSNFSRQIFNTFYKVTNNEELQEQLENLLINNNDYKKELRTKTLDESNLINNYAAQNILDEIKKDLGI